MHVYEYHVVVATTTTPYYHTTNLLSNLLSAVHHQNGFQHDDENGCQHDDERGAGDMARSTDARTVRSWDFVPVQPVTVTKAPVNDVSRHDQEAVSGYMFSI